METAALRHRGLGRRRQVARSSGACCSTPSRSSRTSSRPSSARSRRHGVRLHEPGAAHRRPAGRARAGHHHRRRLPLLRHAQAQVHHRRHPGPRAVHAQHGHRRVDRRPRPRAGRRPQGRARAVAAATRSSPRCCRSRTSWCASTRWTSSTTTQERLRARSAPSSRDFAAKLDDRRPHASSRSRRCTATTSSSTRPTCRGTRARRCSTTSRTCTSRPTATSSTPASRCST